MVGICRKTIGFAGKLLDFGRKMQENDLKNCFFYSDETLIFFKSFCHNYLFCVLLVEKVVLRLNGTQTRADKVSGRKTPLVFLPKKRQKILTSFAPYFINSFVVGITISGLMHRKDGIHV